MEKQLSWLEYNNNVDGYFLLAAVLAGAIIGLFWLIPRLRLSQTTWAIIGFTVIRVPFLFTSFWYDEAFTAWLSRLPFANMIAATAGDVHPPLWYIIEWVTVRVLGDSDVALRLPALALAGIVGWLHLRLCRVWNLGNRLTWVSFWVLALVPFAVRYGAEARMYGLLMALVMLMTLLLETNGQAWLFGVLGALAMLTHNIAFIYVAPLSVYFIYRRRGSSWPMVIGWLIYLPWLPYALNQARQVNEAFWILPTTPGRVLSELHVLFFANPTALSLALAPVLFVLLLVGANSLNPATLRAVWWYAVAPWLIIIPASLLTPIFQARLMIGTLPVLCIVLARGILHICDRLRLPASVAIVGGLALAVALLATTSLRSDWRGLLADVPVQHNDTCYHMSPTSIILAARYVDCHHVMWPHASNLEQHLTDETKAAMLIDMRYVEDTQPAHGNLWLWWGDGPNTTTAERAEVGRIKAIFAPVETFTIFDLDIAEYTVWRLNNSEIAEITD